MYNNFTVGAPMGLRVLILVMCFWAASAQAEFAFVEDELTKCIIDIAKQNGTQAHYKERLEKADTLRIKVATELLGKLENGSFIGSGIVSILAPFTQQEMSEVMAFHSSPLIDYNRFEWEKGLFHNNTLNRLSELYYQHSDNDLDYTTMKDFTAYLDSVLPPQETEAVINGIEQKFIKMQLVANGVAEKLVNHLLSIHDKESLNHWKLIQDAVAIYDGDVITALGVIGLIFDLERVSVKNRSKRLYLGSRIVPLLPGDRTDVLGDNYHFWMYLGAGLQGKGNAAKRMSIAFEGATGDLRDTKADFAGINMGEAIRKAILSSAPTPGCNL